ncbi:serine hydroxymethyltransferase, partial [mine drainage metagenome]
LFSQIDPALVWRIFDNAHWNRIAAVAQTLLELERFGAEYARTVVENARALGGALQEQGLPLVAPEQGFTRSHQLHLDRTQLRERHGIAPGDLARRLERQRLLIDLVGRIGTAEATRLGLRPSEMPRLADLIVRGGLRHEKVGPDVLRWRRSYRTLRFV